MTTTDVVTEPDLVPPVPDTLIPRNVWGMLTVRAIHAHRNASGFWRYWDYLHGVCDALGLDHVEIDRALSDQLSER